MAEETLESRIRIALQNCAGFDGDEVSSARADALDYYFQREITDENGEEIVGRANTVSGDVSAMVDAVGASLHEAFTTESLVEFDPYGAEDQRQVQLESDAVQWFVMGQEDGMIEILTAVKELLMHRNGVLRADVNDITRRSVKTYQNVTPEALPALLDIEGYVDHEYDEDTGDLAVRFDITERKFSMSSVSMENFIYTANWHKPSLEGIPLCAERHISTRAEMVSMGFDKSIVDELPEWGRSEKAETANRNPQGHTKPRSALDMSQEEVEWYDVFARLEAADGIDELRRIAYCNTSATIIQDKPVPFLMHAAGTAILNPHRFTGISLYDKLKQTQDIRTGLQNALLDNVTATTRNKVAGLDGLVNFDDLGDGRATGSVRVREEAGDVRSAVFPFVIPDTSANILAALDFTARQRSEMGGAALDLQSAQLQIGGDRMGSQGLDRAYSVAEQLSASMMKIIATTLIRDAFLLAHRVLREYFDGEVPVKQGSKWITAKPSEWPERVSATVKPGMSVGERQRKIRALTEVINSQIMLSDRGMEGVMTNLEGFNNALMDWCRAAEIGNPERYYLDPTTEEAQAVLKANAEKAKQEDNNSKAIMQMAASIDQIRISLDKYKHDTELQFKYWKENSDAEIEEGKIVGGVVGDMVKGRASNGADGGAEEASTEGSPGESASAGDSGE